MYIRGPAAVWMLNAAFICSLFEYLGFNNIGQTANHISRESSDANVVHNVQNALTAHVEVEKAMDFGWVTFLPAPREKGVPKFKIISDPTIRPEKVEGETIDWVVPIEF
jgi:hypothetical protein